MDDDTREQKAHKLADEAARREAHETGAFAAEVARSRGRLTRTHGWAYPRRDDEDAEGLTWARSAATPKKSLAISITNLYPPGHSIKTRDT
jgi:hypothetical protein